MATCEPSGARRSLPYPAAQRCNRTEDSGESPARTPRPSIPRIHQKGSAVSAMSDLEVLRAACCVAGADGKVDEHERRVIERLAEKAGVGKASLKAMIDMAETDPEFHKNQLGILRTDPGRAVRRLYLTAAINGQVTQQEESLLEHFGRRLGLTDQQLKEEVDRARASFSNSRGSDDA